MKTVSHITQGARLVPAVMAMGAGIMIAAAEPKDSGFLDKVQGWQDKMSDTFRDTWKKLRGEGKPSVVSASVDLREQEHSYVVRLDLPDRDLDKVEIGLKGQELHILAPGTDKLGRYEQSVALSAAVPDAKPEIDRRAKDGVIVVTVPKGPEITSLLRIPEVPSFQLVPSSTWERDVLQQMNDMSRSMDRIFEDSIKDFRPTPGLEHYFDSPRFGSFIDLKEEGSNYVVTAYLPERDVKNVNATIESKVLKIEALAEDSAAQPKDGGNATVARKAYYSQQLTLPGEVQADKMNIERKEGILKVTVPKAG